MSEELENMRNAFEAMKKFADLYYIENGRYRTALGLIRSKQDEATKGGNALALKLAGIAKKALEIRP